jgi:cytochrome b561
MSPGRGIGDVAEPLSPECSALHALAALYHHFWRRDGALQGMLAK